MKNPILIICVFILLIACNKTDGDFGEPIEGPSQISLLDMEIGQKNTYIAFNGENYWANDDFDSYTYLDDTLVIEITAQEENKYEWTESLTPGSDFPHWGGPTAYWVHIQDDSVVIELQEMDYYEGYFFMFLGLNGWGNSDVMKVPLSNFSGVETDVRGWKTTLPYQESYREAYDPELDLHDIDHGRVNIIIDNVPMQVDGNGKTYVYNKSSGFIRTVTYSWWTSTGWGWDIIETDL